MNLPPVTWSSVATCFGHVHRVLERQQDDAGPNPHLAGLRSESAQEGCGLEDLDGIAEVVLTRECAVEPQITRQLHLLHERIDPERHGTARWKLSAEE